MPEPAGDLSTSRSQRELGGLDVSPWPVAEESEGWDTFRFRGSDDGVVVSAFCLPLPLFFGFPWRGSGASSADGLSDSSLLALMGGVETVFSPDGDSGSRVRGPSRSRRVARTDWGVTSSESENHWAAEEPATL